MRKLYIAILLLVCYQPIAYSQTLNPITLTGFNQDLIAEGGPSSTATTTTYADGPTSVKVMYSNNFRSFAMLTYGGLPDNGTINVTGATYQLANYTGNNILMLGRGQSGALTLATPASYSRLRILCFSAEGSGRVDVTLNFTDGTSTQYLSNAAMSDWFFGTANVVLQSYGRVNRSTAGPYTADQAPNEPRMYYLEINPTCTDLPKLIQSIQFNNISTGSTPFPNEIFLAASGVPYSMTIANTITPSDCSGPNGSIALTVTGSSTTYSYSWNTTPVQTTATATNLAPGPYTCIITDANNCTTTYNGTVTLNNNGSISAAANPTAICAGESSTLTATVNTGNFTNFSWTPGTSTGASITVSPTTNTTYTVSSSNSVGCNVSATVSVTVNPKPAAPDIIPDTICVGETPTLVIRNPVAGQTYHWFSTATGGTSLATGNTFSPSTAASSYFAQAMGTGGCTSATRGEGFIRFYQVLPAPVVQLTNATFSSLTFSWSAITGATAYQVSIDNGTTFTAPSSGATGTTHTISGLPSNETVTIIVKALGAVACEESPLSAPVSGTTLSSREIFVPNVFTPNGDGNNDILKVLGNYIQSMEFRIFNQWGQLVFFSNDLNLGWDGTFQRKPQPAGVYAYSLRAVSPEGVVTTKKGSITLLR